MERRDLSETLTDPRAKMTAEQVAAAFAAVGVPVEPTTINSWAMSGLAPTDPYEMLTRRKLASVLTAIGYRITVPTLASYASRGGGPPFAQWGPLSVYQWYRALAWAKAKLPELGHSTSELHSRVAAESLKARAAAKTKARDATAEPHTAAQ
jgi:hypothetical protein